jgi:membrane-associated protease RseP (regulator of RpoE activity)
LNDTQLAGPTPDPDLPSAEWSWRPAPKFQQRYGLHLVLFLLTLGSTTWVGSESYSWFQDNLGLTVSPILSSLAHGLWYSIPVLSILGAHEFGHYALCRVHDVDATLPYFLPAPLISGTLGAVIRIREPFPSKSALFDIGVAGPIAGFVLLVPALFLGMTLSNVVPAPTHGSVLFLGEPLLFKLATYAVFGSVPDAYTVNIHPMVFAAWFGMLATALNLLPFGQLDGGHITYATLGRWATPISVATVATAVCMTFVSISWLVMTIMMVAMLLMFGPRHPRVIYEDEPLGQARVAVALFALVMFILCFTPVPIQLQDLVGTR